MSSTPGKGPCSDISIFEHGRPVTQHTNKTMTQNKATSLTDKKILIFTDRPESYHCEKISQYMNIEFCSCPEEFCCAMLRYNYSGQILDMRKVMETPCCSRDRILSFIASTPTMRTTLNAEEPVYFDNQDEFICDCLQYGGLLPGAACPLNVDIPVEISLDDDPAMARSCNGTIHHLTYNGCSFHTDADLTGNDFFYLKIYTLKNSLPIYVGVCNEQGSDFHSCGYRVRFLYIKDDQLQELSKKYINY